MCQHVASRNTARIRIGIRHRVYHIGRLYMIHTHPHTPIHIQQTIDARQTDVSFISRSNIKSLFRFMQPRVVGCIDTKMKMKMKKENLVRNDRQYRGSVFLPAGLSGKYRFSTKLYTPHKYTCREYARTPAHLSHIHIPRVLPSTYYLDIRVILTRFYLYTYKNVT